MSNRKPASDKDRTASSSGRRARAQSKRDIGAVLGDPRQFSALPEHGGMRLDVFVCAMFEDQDLSREKVKGWIKQGLVLVNDTAQTRPGRRLDLGDAISVHVPACTGEEAPMAESGELEIKFRDSNLVVLNKPAGLTVHPAPSCPQGTLVNRLLHHFPGLSAISGSRPGIVHRIDKDTSGLLTVALNEKTRGALAKAFAKRRVDKEYLCVTRGCPSPASGDIDLPLGRHPTQKVKMAVAAKGGKDALTIYRTLYADPDKLFSLLAVKIHTGRTHQIRVHLSHLGHPLLGDATYGGGHALDELTPRFPFLPKLVKRQLLHAWRLGFMHPVTGQAMRFLCPPPKDFFQGLLELSRRTQRVVLTGLPGCGKSAVLALLTDSGVPVFSADRAVAELYEPGQDGWSYLSSRFGERFLLPDQRIDKRLLFNEMRQDEAIRKEVEAVVHPMVRHRLQAFWRENRHKRLAAAEIPLFLEAAVSSDPGYGANLADVLVGVACPARVRHKRLQESRGWDGETVAAMESWQWPEDKKLGACDLLVNNSGSLDDLAKAVAVLERDLAQKRRSSARQFAAMLESLFRNGSLPS